MALNEIAKHFYEKEVDRLLDLGDRDIIKNKFLDMRSQIDDLYVELGERARRIVELKKESGRPATGGVDRVFAFGKEIDIRELFDELLKANKRIAELESELSVKEDLLKIKNGLREEEPLPFSSDEYEEDRIDKIEKVVLGIQGFLKKETEQKIKELEEEQKRLMRETAHQQFISDLVHAKLREMRGL